MKTRNGRWTRCTSLNLKSYTDGIVPKTKGGTYRVSSKLSNIARTNDSSCSSRVKKKITRFHGEDETEERDVTFMYFKFSFFFRLRTELIFFFFFLLFSFLIKNSPSFAAWFNPRSYRFCARLLIRFRECCGFFGSIHFPPFFEPFVLFFRFRCLLLRLGPKRSALQDILRNMGSTEEYGDPYSFFDSSSSTSPSATADSGSAFPLLAFRQLFLLNELDGLPKNLAREITCWKT